MTKDNEQKIRELKLAIKQFRQSMFVFTTPEQIADIKKQIDHCKKLARCKYYGIIEEGSQDVSDVFDPYDHTFNSAILVERTSQNTRQAHRHLRLADNDGRHWDRKFGR